MSEPDRETRAAQDQVVRGPVRAVSRRSIWGRRVGIAFLILLTAAGLAGLAGGRDVEERAEGRAGAVQVRAPERVRGGMIDEVRVELEARRTLAQPSIVLPPALLDHITLNTIIPEPVAHGRAGEGGLLSYAPLRAGERLVVRIQFQVNPSALGSRRWEIRVTDGAREVARAGWDILILP